jgi:hypothetical protein
LPKLEAVNPPPNGGYHGGNTAEGQDALFSLTTGTYNTAVGFFSLRALATDQFNTATGAGALLVNTADQNTATGAGTLLNNTTGDSNRANGTFALFDNTTGSSNTANGVNALLNNTTGGANTALGGSAGLGVTTATNVICIGIDGANVNNSCFIGNIYGVTTHNGDAIPVLIDYTGQLGTINSSHRFKKEIKPMDTASEAVLALQTVTFHYKNDTAGTAQFGLIAEKVAEVNPDLVVLDKDGKPYTVRYAAVNSMMLNEFLKEHHKVEKLEAAVASLAATVKEQAAQLQRVSAQVGTKRPAVKIVSSNP